jgi:hypothetical protein
MHKGVTTMPARASIRRRFSPFARISPARQEAIIGKAAKALPRRWVFAVSAAVFASAVFAAIWTLSVDAPGIMADADGPVTTGAIRAN